MKWACAWRFPLAVIVIISAYFIVPIACLFTRLEIRTDTMKRRAKALGLPEYTQFTEMRTYLHPAFNWYQTHDNAMCEFWHGNYQDSLGINGLFNDKDFERFWLLRYYNLVRWGLRNKAYWFRYAWLGIPQSFDEPSVFKDGDTTISIYDNYFLYEKVKGDKKQKTGWNSHRSAPVLSNGRKNVMYAIY